MNIIKYFLDNYKFSKKEIEEVYNDAKNITIDDFNVDEEKFTNKHYDYIIKTMKQILDIKESNMWIDSFLKSDKKSKEYFKEQETSGSIGGSPGQISSNTPVPEPLHKKYEEPKDEVKEDIVKNNDCINLNKENWTCNIGCDQVNVKINDTCPYESINQAQTCPCYSNKVSE